MKVILRWKGGARSGHRGHAGRPGKRGGSLPGSGGDEFAQRDAVLNTPEMLARLHVPAKLYHVTSADRAEDIKKNGLKVSQDRTSTEGSSRGVYVTDDPRDIADRQPDIVIRDPVVLEIDTTGLKWRLDPEYFYYDDLGKSSVQEYINGVNDGTEQFALYTHGDIPAAKILSIKPY